MHWLLFPALVVLLQPLERPRFEKVAPGTVEVTARLPLVHQPELPLGPVPPELGEAYLRLCLVNPETGRLGPPLLGRYRRQGEVLIFRPRVSLSTGQLYRAIVGKQGGPVAWRDYTPPPRHTSTEPPRVVKIYPTADVLPANHLRFHIFFSVPMRGGQEIFRQIVLMDEDGKQIENPCWLMDELWDETDQCLILYIHPGRIKYGLLLREVLGPVLVPNRRYTLIIRQEMRDADGRKLDRAYRKTFRTSAEERTRIELKDWQLQSPAAGTTQPLVVRSPRSIDVKSLQRFLSVVDEKGNAVAATLTVGAEEKTWSLTPAQPWSAAGYRLRVHPRLEDSCGNTPMRPFDLDLDAPVPPPQELDLPFWPTTGKR